MNQKNRLYLVLGLLSVMSLAFSFSANTVKKISMIMVARSNKNGKTATIKSEILSGSRREDGQSLHPTQ
jgi:hypothetical protein